MYEDFVRERITNLRIKKGVSEYQMSYDLGHSRGYVYNISSGKALPPLKEFFAICDYFEITPQQFFDDSSKNPELIQKAIEGMKQLDLIIVPYENAEGFGIKSLINKLREENTALNKISEVGIFIGPEGGIEEDEILKLKEIGAHIVTLGNRILRTETAGFTAASLIQYELGDLGGVI